MDGFTSILLVVDRTGLTVNVLHGYGLNWLLPEDLTIWILLSLAQMDNIFPAAFLI